MAVNCQVAGSSPFRGAFGFSTNQAATRVNARRREIGFRAFCVYGPLSARVCAKLAERRDVAVSSEYFRGPKGTFKVPLAARNLGPKLSESLINSPSGVNRAFPFGVREGSGFFAMGFRLNRIPRLLRAQIPERSINPRHLFLNPVVKASVASAEFQDFIQGN